MQFIVSGERIATENFSIGKVYTVTFTNGNYFVNSCVGIGPDFVMFQQESPKMLFCLDMESAETVSSIDESGGGAGTMNYNELDNKPSINGVPLIGNKTAEDLSILPVPIVGENDNNKILTASYSGGVGSYSWQPAPSSGTTDYTQLSNKPQINSVELDGNKSLEDLGIASVEALAGKQDAISDLNTIRSGAAAGATAVQPATLASYQTLIDSSHKLSSDLVDDTGHDNKFATAAQLDQIETNKNNISLIESMQGKKNYLQLAATINVDGTGITATKNSDNSITINGTATSTCYVYLNSALVLSAGTYVMYCPQANTDNIQMYDNGTWNAKVNNTRTFDGNTSTFIIIRISSGQTIDNVKFYPMILTDTMYSSGLLDYQPYSMSNAEITAWILAHS